MQARKRLLLQGDSPTEEALQRQWAEQMREDEDETEECRTRRDSNEDSHARMTLELVKLGCPKAQEDYRDEHIRVLLRLYSPRRLAKNLVLARDEFKRIMDVFESIPVEILERLMNTGAVFIRGVDRGGHPIVWVTESRLWGEGRIVVPPEYFAAYAAWVQFHGLAMRRPNVVGLAYILCEGKRKNLGFSHSGWLHFLRHLGSM